MGPIKVITYNEGSRRKKDSLFGNVSSSPIAFACIKSINPKSNVFLGNGGKRWDREHGVTERTIALAVCKGVKFR